MKSIVSALCVLITSFAALGQQHEGNFKYEFYICSGDTNRIGIAPQIDALHIWPEISPFFEYYGDTVGVYFENTGTEEILIENFITRFYQDGFVTSDTLILHLLPEIQINLPELGYSICPSETLQIYYPPVPYGFMYTTPDSSSNSVLNEGSPRIDVFPNISTIYQLYIENLGGCRIGPFDLTVNVQVQSNLVGISLPDSICTNSEAFEINFYPGDAFVYGSGVEEGYIFNPLLAGPGWHEVTIETGLGGCFVRKSDSLFIVSESDVIFPDIDNICENDPKITLTGGFPGGGIYLGEGVSTITSQFNPLGLTPGNYEITYRYVGSDGCRLDRSQTVFVKAIPDKPELLFNGDSTACAGDTLILNSSIFASRYEWNTGDTTQFIQAFNTGLYYVTIVASNGCRNYSDTTLLSFNPQPELTLVSPTFPNGFNLSAYGSSDGSIDAIITGGVEPFYFTWSNGETTEDLENIPSGFYQLTISDLGGCGDSDTITLTRPDSIVVPPQPEDFDLLIPNAFTPNGDGFNDVYFIRGLIPEHVENEFYVFDFRRQLVYSAKNYSNTWDGTDNDGKRLLTGTYYGVFKSNGLEKPFTTVIDLRYE
jgi:gliding motility-associated-like protein